MANENEAIKAQTAINRMNSEIKRDVDEISKFATLVNNRCSSDGTEDGDDDATIAAAVAAIGDEVDALIAQVDVLFPYVKYESTYPDPTAAAAAAGEEPESEGGEEPDPCEHD